MVGCTISHVATYVLDRMVAAENGLTESQSRYRVDKAVKLLIAPLNYRTVKMGDFDSRKKETEQGQ